ncbi:hypothetical protein GH714_036809 [Hevea brasiliensis]|uniref:Uncharacterized protein n=1 Tax=Hevea brasiliensis TaxID=3981 RepID=A0A6A6MNG5_HEVBR|nr:hypothetical protein GH714_036809 [Hevea brasiliensis]
MESETASSADEQVVGAAPPLGADTRGKHRILAELKRVEQEIKFLEDIVDLVLPISGLFRVILGVTDTYAFK